VSGQETIDFIHADADVVVTLEAGSTVTCLGAADGAVRWTNQLADRLTRFVGIDRLGGRVLASGESDLFVLDVDTGNVLNRQQYQKIVSTRPAIFGNLLIYGTGTNEVFAHMVISAVQGMTAWGNHVNGAVEAAPTLVGSSVGVVTQNGSVLFVDAATGSPVGANRIHGGLATDPVASEQAMYVAGLDQSVWAFHVSGGGLIWRHRTQVPLRQQPTLHGGTLYCAVEGEGLLAFDAGTGQVRWTAEDVGGTVIAINRGRLVVWDGKTMRLMDASRGDVLESAVFPRVARLITDKFEDGNLIAVSTRGIVAKFAPR
jgi:outer membrane protein assembly factor BamB